MSSDFLQTVIKICLQILESCKVLSREETRISPIRISSSAQMSNSKEI